MKNTQIEVYKSERDPKYHELRLLEIISERHKDFQGSLLDIACAAGVFIRLINQKFQKANYTGFDISSELIDIAKTRFEDKKNVMFEIGDALTYSPLKTFDIVVASGVLSIFEDFEKPLEKWLSFLKESGELYVFGCFNSRDIDTIVRFRNNYQNGEWEGGYTSYSVHTIGKYLTAKNLIYEFIPFNLPIDLPESEDPIRSYTKNTLDGEKLILTGANFLTEFYFLVIRKV